VRSIQNPEEEPLESDEVNHIVQMVNLAHVGQRLDVFVFELLPQLPSRSFSTKMVENGYVLVNGIRKKSSHRLQLQENVTVDLSCLTPHAENPTAEEIPLHVLFEDQEILVVNKPAGLVVHPGAGVANGTLVNAILHHCGQTLPSLGAPTRAGIVHRLDKDTSGVMIVAKTANALANLSEQFSKHTQGRVYWALVALPPQQSEGQIETRHGRDPKNRLKFSVVKENSGKFAKLRFRVKETYVPIGALVECELETGRTHQIRVQLTHIGSSLIGDPLYGNAHQHLSRFPNMAKKLEKVARRQMLHAVSLELNHPTTGERLKFETPPPEDFLSALALLSSRESQ
jgi:23S rRNA pseudouridine1911/1915/1917 synthase